MALGDETESSADGPSSFSQDDWNDPDKVNTLTAEQIAANGDRVGDNAWNALGDTKKDEVFQNKLDSPKLKERFSDYYKTKYGGNTDPGPDAKYLGNGDFLPAGDGGPVVKGGPFAGSEWTVTSDAEGNIEIKTKEGYGGTLKGNGEFMLRADGRTVCTNCEKIEPGSPPKEEPPESEDTSSVEGSSNVEISPDGSYEIIGSADSWTITSSYIDPKAWSQITAQLREVSNGGYDSSTGSIHADSVRTMKITTARTDGTEGTIYIVNGEDIEFGSGVLKAKHADSIVVDRSVTTDADNITARYEDENIYPVVSVNSADQLSITGGNNEVFTGLGESTLVMDGHDIIFAHITSSEDNNLLSFVSTIENSGGYIEFTADKGDIIDIYFPGVGGNDAIYTRIDKGVSLKISDHGEYSITFTPLKADAALVLLDQGIDVNSLERLAEEIPLNFAAEANQGKIMSYSSYEWSPRNLIDLDYSGDEDGAWSSKQYLSSKFVTDVYFPQRFVYYLNGIRTLDHITLFNTGTGHDAKEFELYTTMDEDYKYAEWEKTAEGKLLKMAGPQKYRFSQKDARFIKIEIKSSYSGTFSRLAEIELYDNENSNILPSSPLMLYATQNWSALNLNDQDTRNTRNTAWSSDTYQALRETEQQKEVYYPQEIVFGFADNEKRIINRIKIANMNAKSFNIYATKDRKIRTDNWKKILSGKLDKSLDKEFMIRDIEARYLKLEITSGYEGNKAIIKEFEAYGLIPFTGQKALSHSNLPGLLSRGLASLSFILDEHISWSGMNLGTMPLDIMDNLPTYIPRKGILEYSNANITETIVANNSIALDLSMAKGIESMQLTPPGYYYYIDNDNPARNFAAGIDEYAPLYRLSLRKSPEESFDTNCDSCGVIDFVDKKMRFNGMINYLRHPIRNSQLAGLLLRRVYSGIGLPRASLTLDEDLVFISRIFQAFDSGSEIESLTTPDEYYNISEMFVEDAVSTVITVNPGISPEDVSESIISVYTAQGLERPIEMSRNVLDYNTGNSRLRFYPPGHANNTRLMEGWYR